MNACSFVGRIATDLELKESGETKYLRFKLAVRRQRGKDKDGNPITDFVPCVAFGKTAEFIHKYFKKGDYIFINASFRSDKYTANDGTTKIMYDFYVENAGFCSSSSNSRNTAEDNTATFAGQPVAAAAVGVQPSMPQSFTPPPNYVELPF